MLKAFQTVAKGYLYTMMGLGYTGFVVGGVHGVIQAGYDFTYFKDPKYKYTLSIVSPFYNAYVGYVCGVAFPITIYAIVSEPRDAIECIKFRKGEFNYSM
jgi:hypothetical protein